MVLCDEHPGYALLTLNVPARRNPLSAGLRAALLGELERLKAVTGVRCVVITGAGPAFCSGMDLDELARCADTPVAEHLADSRALADFFEYVRTYPKVTLAAVNGPAVAGGCGLALVCDLILAAESASFCFSEVRIGFVPALVSVYLQRAAGPKFAAEMLYSARTTRAAEAQGQGWINRVVPGTELLRDAAELAQRVAAQSPIALVQTKALLSAQWAQSGPEALEAAILLNAQARGSSDCKEGVRAFLEKRPPRWN